MYLARLEPRIYPPWTTLSAASLTRGKTACMERFSIRKKPAARSMPIRYRVATYLSSYKPSMPILPHHAILVPTRVRRRLPTNGVVVSS